MKKWIAVLMLVIMLCAAGFAEADPLNTIQEMETVINNTLEASKVEGVEQLCMYLEDMNTFGIGIESEVIENSAVEAGTGKSKKNWNSFKAYVYKLYGSTRDLLDTFGHDQEKLTVMLRSSNNGESFIYYMLSEKDGGEIEVYDPITGDEKPVQEK